MALSSYRGRYVRPNPNQNMGRRVSPTPLAAEPPIVQTVDSSTLIFSKMNGRMIKKYFGIRITHPIVYDSRVQFATWISALPTTGPRIYKIIQKKALGTRRRWYTDDNIQQMALTSQDHLNRTRTGVSTVGTDFNPTIITNPGSTRVRRWPRDWHGENMQ
jgi:hypothetical protein